MRYVWQTDAARGELDADDVQQVVQLLVDDGEWDNRIVDSWLIVYDEDDVKVFEDTNTPKPISLPALRKQMGVWATDGAAVIMMDLLNGMHPSYCSELEWKQLCSIAAAEARLHDLAGASIDMQDLVFVGHSQKIDSVVYESAHTPHYTYLRVTNHAHRESYIDVNSNASTDDRHEPGRYIGRLPCAYIA